MWISRVCSTRDWRTWGIYSWHIQRMT
jgi:hypothetical protein